MRLTADEFDRERRYQTVMYFIRQMLDRLHPQQRDGDQSIRQAGITALHLRVERLFCSGFWQIFMLQLVKSFLNLFTGGDVDAEEQHRA